MSNNRNWNFKVITSGVLGVNEPFTFQNQNPFFIVGAAIKLATSPTWTPAIFAIEGALDNDYNQHLLNALTPKTSSLRDLLEVADFGKAYENEATITLGLAAGASIVAYIVETIDR
jgi:hypothetical protein